MSSERNLAPSIRTFKRHRMAAVHGFQVNRVSHGRSVIEFSGTESQVEEALHTPIHNYAVMGKSTGPMPVIPKFRLRWRRSLPEYKL